MPKDWTARKRAKSAVSAGHHGGSPERVHPVGWIESRTKFGGRPGKTALSRDETDSARYMGTAPLLKILGTIEVPPKRDH